MIEFKAECGHTVRSRDEDAGGVVRCSYCGRDTPVPEKADGDLDFLFREFEETSRPDKSFNKRRRPGWASGLRRKRRKPGAFDPFAVVVKLCYVAALIIVVVVVARKWVLPMFDAEQRSRRFASREADTREPDAASRRTERKGRSAGLIRGATATGLYIGSTPQGASAYYLEQSAAPMKGRIANVAGVRRIQTSGECSRLADGDYVVEIAFPWNDPQLSNAQLSNHQNFFAFRRKIEHASDETRRQLVEDYFIPDEATDAFIAETVDQFYIVRQYRNVSVRGGRSEGVRAFFLPRIPSGNQSFSIEPLVTGYISNLKAYAFDEANVLNELGFYGVAPENQRFVLEALSRIGSIPYVTPDGRARLFKIGIHDGVFSSRVVRESVE